VKRAAAAARFLVCFFVWVLLPLIVFCIVLRNCRAFVWCKLPDVFVPVVKFIKFIRLSKSLKFGLGHATNDVWFFFVCYESFHFNVPLLLLISQGSIPCTVCRRYTGRAALLPWMQDTRLRLPCRFVLDPRQLGMFAALLPNA